MKSKIKKLQLFRLITQIVFLIYLPGLFILTFSEIEKVYLMLIKGNFNFAQAFPSIIEAITVIVLTVIFGRFFCGWFCAFGTLNDIVYLISKKIFKIKFKVNEKLDNVLKYLKYVVLLLNVILIWSLGSQAFNTASPWDAFAQITNLPQGFSDYTIGFILLGLIIIGAMFIERFFCRYFCPLGAIFTLISKFRIIKIDKSKEGCGKCRACTNECAMGLKLYEVDNVNSTECIDCLKCVEVCPRKNAHISLLKEKFNPVFISALVIAIFALLYSGNLLAANVVESNNTSTGTTTADNSTTSTSGTVANSSTASTTNSGTTQSSAASTSTGTTQSSTASTSSTTTSTSSSTSQSAKYKDGTYEGTATGYRPGLTVSVTVKDGKISAIEIIAINDTPNFYAQPVKTIPTEIISAQSTSVDAVSGATRTSNGIMNAVEDALTKAKI